MPLAFRAMRRTLATALVVATLTTGSAAAETRPDTLQRDTDALLAQGAPGVLVELDTPRGERKVRSGYGDVDDRTPVPWQARFRIGSYTKTFVAVTLLQLVGEGRLSLQDTVERWLPGVVTGNGNDGSRITVRQVLQQTSGLPDYLERMPWLFEEKGFQENRFSTSTTEEQVALAMSLPPKFPPGTDWQYSNTNYLLAGMIIESVTGRGWRSAVQARIIRPLGLRDTYLPGENPRVPGPHATGYQRFPEPGTDPENPTFLPAIDVTEMNPSWGGAAGEMISTTADGNRFLRALLGGRVLRPAQLAELKKTVPAKAFEFVWPGVRYGLGLMWMPTSCGGMWFHGGDIHGFKTRNGATEDGRRSVMVSINTDSMVPTPGTPPATEDHANDLIEHALCGE
jgi:D-alanyl-D-alanine carboxypeptidase